MQLHTLSKKAFTQKPKARVGRGGKRGKTCGHGHKGQKQHGRHGIRPEMRDFIKKLPKLRGYGKNRAKTVNNDGPAVQIVKTDDLNTLKTGTTVTPKTLVESGLAHLQGNKLPEIKILTGGDIKTKLTIEGCAISESAKEMVKKAGGEVK